MKRKDPRKLIRAFLEYLDSYHYNKNKRTIDTIKNNFYHHYNQLINDLKLEKYIIEEENTIRLTSKGLSYLDDFREAEFKEEQRKINKSLLMATIIIAASALLQFSVSNPNLKSISTFSFVLIVIILALGVYLLFNLFKLIF